MQLAIPVGVAEAAELTAAIDDVLGEGFARLRPDQVAQLEDVAAALSGTPLGSAVTDALQRLAGGELLAHHLGVIAAARASLEGARADALFNAAAAAAGYMVEDAYDVSAGPSREPSLAPRIESVQQWLVELALAGLAQLDMATVVPIVATLEGLQGKPGCERLSALLTGFAFELLDSAPTHQLEDPPLRRWADLWTRSMLATYGTPEQPAAREVSGTLTVIGSDIRHFDQVISIVIHSAFRDADGPLRLVRTTLSSWKVDAVAGAEIWNLLSPLCPALVGALAKPVEITVTGATLLASGDLLADGMFEAGPATDPFALDLTGAVVARAAPRDRHAMQLAFPVIGKPEGVEVDLSRLSPHSDYDEDEVGKSTDMVGLLRFDNGWTFQPMAGRKGKKTFGPAEGIAAAAKVKKPALGILRERASKLLRR